MTLAGRTAWITGAGKGIGETLAKALSGHGVTVALTARTRSDLERVASDIAAAGGKAVIAPADVSDEHQVATAFGVVQEALGTPDILVNNAGIGIFAPVSELRLEDLDRMWAVNMRGVFLCTKAVLPGMQARDSGIIVNMSSLAGKNAFANGAGYAATKWALKGFSDCLRLEVRKHHVKVITVYPGSVATEFSGSEKSASRLATILHPEDIASAIIAALQLPDRAMMSEIDLRPTHPTS